MKLIKSETAEAELVGHVIILGITILGISMIALYGVPAILGLQDMANLKNAEQTFTVLDSRASRTVLGNSPLQVTSINLAGGTLTVVPNSTNSSSYIVVRDRNNTFNVTIPMGKITYQLGDRIVAYEGGGVWSKYPSGSVMLSRPEFNYNGVTLTLPVFDVSGSASVGGKGTAVVSIKKNPPQVLFPSPPVTQQTTTTMLYKWDFSGTGDTFWKCVIPCTWAVSIGGETWTLSFAPPGFGQTWSGGYIGAGVGVGAGAGTVTWQSPNFTWNNGTPTSANLSFDRQVPDTFKNSRDCQSPSPCSFSVVLVKPDGNTSVLYSGTFTISPLPWTTLSNATVLPSDFTLPGNYSLRLIATLSVSNGGNPLYFAWDNPTLTLNKTVTNIIAGPNRTNPVNYTQVGTVYVNITSDFYDAWADYVKTLSSLRFASVDKANRTAGIALTVYPAYIGAMNYYIADPISFVGLDGSNSAPLNDFSFRIYSNDQNGWDGKVNWDIRSGSGSRRLIYHITASKNPAYATVNVGYEDDGKGYIKPAETWKGANNLFPVQGVAPNQYVDVDLLSTSTSLNYTSVTVGTDSSCTSAAKINSGAFNDTGPGFSWSSPLVPPTNAQYKWSFDSSNEGWTNTSTGSATMGFDSANGNPKGSIYSSRSGNNQNATATWTSPNFSWANGTPASASLSFDWSVTTYNNGNPGKFSVNLVKPDGTTSQIYPNTTYNATSAWTTFSNATVSVNDFTQPGNYSLQLVSTLNTGSSPSTVRVAWDNPTITLTYGSSTSKSLYNITEHYIQLMAQGGEFSFDQCSPSDQNKGKGPDPTSTMFIDYFAPGGLTYLHITDNRADVSIS